MRLISIILDILMLVALLIEACLGIQVPVWITIVWVLIALLAHIDLYKEEE